MKKIFIGFKDDYVINSNDTYHQVLELKRLKLNLQHEDGQDVKWLDIYDSRNPRSIIQAIILDRRKRVDYKKIMADRPCTCVVTINDDCIDRIEYYEGHDALKLIYDIRSKSLQGVQLEKSYEDEVCIINAEDIAHETIVKRENDDNLLYYARNTETLEQHRSNYIKALTDQVLNLIDIGGVEE